MIRLSPSDPDFAKKPLHLLVWTDSINKHRTKDKRRVSVLVLTSREKSSLPSQEKTQQEALLYAPQRILGLDCVYIVRAACRVCSVYISIPRRNGWHIYEHFLAHTRLFIYHRGSRTCGRRRAGDWFAHYKLRTDISIMSPFVIHDNATSHWSRSRYTFIEAYFVLFF